MSHSSEASKIGRKPIHVVEIDIPMCRKNYNSTSTNEFLQANFFDNASWTKSNTTVDANRTDVRGPHYAFNTDRVLDTSDGSAVQHLIYQNSVSVAVNDVLWISVYARAVSDSASSKIALTAWGQSYVKFDIDPTNFQVISAISGSDYSQAHIEHICDGWFRISARFVKSNTNSGMFIVLLDDNGDDSYQGTASIWVDLWGAQLQKNPSPDQLGHAVATTTVPNSSTCNASGSAGSECYRTYATCQSITDFSLLYGTLRFCEPLTGIPNKHQCIPLLTTKAPSITPNELTPGKGLGIRGAIDISAKDIPYHDRQWNIDPYWGTRSYDALTQGTFWGKFHARNRYMKNKEVRYRSGYIADTFTWNDFDKRTYLITDIDGPDSGDKVKIAGKDIFELGANDTVMVPAANTGYLDAAIAVDATTATLAPSGVGADEYPASGYAKIGDEIVYFTRSSDTLTLIRSQYGSEAAEHNADDKVQVCKVWDGTDNIINAYYDLLTGDVGIGTHQVYFSDSDSSTYEFDIAKYQWLSDFTIKGILTEPTPANKIISEWAEVAMFNTWWDPEQALIRLKCVVPDKDADIGAISEDTGIVKNSFKAKRDESLRVSQVWVDYDKINQLENDEVKNYQKGFIAADLAKETSSQYNEQRVKRLISKWIDPNKPGIASTYASRILNRYRDSPYTIQFDTDAKDDSIDVSDLVDVSHRTLQDETGATKTVRIEIIKKEETVQGHMFRFTGLESNYTGRYGYVGPNTLNDYSAESDANKADYGFICLDTGLFSDGTDGYLII